MTVQLSLPLCFHQTLLTEYPALHFPSFLNPSFPRQNNLNASISVFLHFIHSLVATSIAHYLSEQKIQEACFKTKVQIIA